MLTGRLDPAALGQALNEIVRRHGVLRTTLAPRAGQPVLTLVPRLALPLPVLDMTPLGTAAAQAELRRLAAGRQRPVTPDRSVTRSGPTGIPAGGALRQRSAF